MSDEQNIPQLVTDLLFSEGGKTFKGMLGVSTGRSHWLSMLCTDRYNQTQSMPKIGNNVKTEPMIIMEND